MTSKNNDAILEAKILGAVFQAPSLFAQLSVLGKEAFYDNTHSVIYDCMNACVETGKTISVSTIGMFYEDRIKHIGGTQVLDRIASQGSDTITHFGVAVGKLRELSQWRTIVDLSARLTVASENKERSPDEILSGISKITQQLITGGKETSRSKRSVAASALARAREERETITTGIDSLDFLMQGGIQPGRLYAFGGLHGRGKTILLGSISDNINLQKQPHLFISMETEPEDIEIRNCSAHINQNASVLFDQDDEGHKEALARAEKVISATPDVTHYEFAPGATINEIVRMILRAKTRHNIKGFILDYWQLIRGREKGVSEAQHLAEAADKMAAVCRQENLWGLVTAQVDDKGNLVTSNHMLRSASLYVRLIRDEDEQSAYFVTEKSNYTRYGDTGSESVPGMIFDMAVGPKFRNTNDMDLPGLTQENSDRLEV